MAGVTARAVAAAAVCLLFAAGPATANGVTFPIAEGVSGPYRYEVGVGPFSPLRKALFVAVTLMADGSPVIDADVTVTVSVDGSSSEIGPLDAANSLTHLATYEVSLDLPELAREMVYFEIGVDGRRGAAVIEAEMVVPDVVGTFNGDSVPATVGPAPGDETPNPEVGAPGGGGDEPSSTAGPAYLGVALLAVLVGAGLGVLGLVGYRRRQG